MADRRAVEPTIAELAERMGCDPYWLENLLTSCPSCNPPAPKCKHCGRKMTSRRADFCPSPWSACSKRAARRRKAGLPENAYPDGAQRGRVPLTQATHRERQTAKVREIPIAGGWSELDWPDD